MTMKGRNMSASAKMVNERFELENFLDTTFDVAPDTTP